MSKITQYFNSENEMNAYYPNGVPSGVLAIVQKEGESGAMLYTSTNNAPNNPGQSESQGGDDPEAVDLTNDILYGDED